jgi:cytochrome c-type biogenesis protein CcmH/NrfG
VTLKRELNDECITYCNDALEIDHRHVKALYLKGKAFINKTEYIKAADVFKCILEIDPENKDAA